jgi:hypothetical protein
MSDSHDDDLDRRIRRLISEAGAEAPIATGLLPTVKISPDGSPTSLLARKGLLVGAVSVVAVLAIVIVVLIRKPDGPPSLEPIVPTTVALTTVATTSAPSTDWVQVQRVVAPEVGSSTIEVDYDVCSRMPPSKVVESDTEVRITTMMKHPGGSEKACGSFENITLAKPIGTRKVIDQRRNREVPILFVGTAAPVHLVGSVHDVIGNQGDATVTAILIIDPSGAGVMCDDLPDFATTCVSAPLAVDWAAGSAKPPTGLTKRGTYLVSAQPITLRGSLKDNTLYVGVTP